MQNTSLIGKATVSLTLPQTTIAAHSSSTTSLMAFFLNERSELELPACQFKIGSLPGYGNAFSQCSNNLSDN
jgi:hypothetical protein